MSHTAHIEANIPAGIIARAKRILETRGRLEAEKYYRWHRDYYLKPRAPGWLPAWQHELAIVTGLLVVLEHGDAAEEWLSIDCPDLDRRDNLTRLQETAKQLGYPVPWPGVKACVTDPRADDRKPGRAA